MIDWDKFSARAPAGAMINHRGTLGFLLETYPYKRLEENVQARSSWEGHEKFYDFEPFDLFPDTLSYQPYYPTTSLMRRGWSNPENFIYLIDGQWKTFDEVMA